MKKFNILFLLGLFLIFTACENDEDRLYVNSSDLVTAPVLSLEGINDITITEENIDLIPAILTWTRSDYGKDVLVEYTLQMANSEDFSAPYSTILGNELYTKALSSKNLSDWVINQFNGLDENGEGIRTDLYMRISASIALENPTVTIPPDVLYSNAIHLSVVPYYLPAAYPTEMYMIGKGFGDWSWDSDGVVDMIPVWGFEGHFWCIRYITAGEGFKWCSKKAWNGDFSSLGEDIGFYTEGGDAFVEESGLYMVYMDMENNRISVETAKVYGMGDCFGSWDVGTHAFDIDGNKMTRTTSGSGEIRMYAISDIAPIGSDWWKMEFVPINNVIEYRGAGDDQTRVNVDAGKKVTLDFNAGTGNFE